MRLKDPFAKTGLAPWKKWCIAIACLAVVSAGLWIFNLLEWANLPSPLERYHKTVLVEESDSTAVTDSTSIEIVINEQTTLNQ